MLEILSVWFSVCFLLNSQNKELKEYRKSIFWVSNIHNLNTWKVALKSQLGLTAVTRDFNSDPRSWSKKVSKHPQKLGIWNMLNILIVSSQYNYVLYLCAALLGHHCANAPMECIYWFINEMWNVRTMLNIWMWFRLQEWFEQFLHTVLHFDNLFCRVWVALTLSHCYFNCCESTVAILHKGASYKYVRATFQAPIL